DYWDKKLKTFTVKEIPDWWKNSQLVDTQIISKYSRAYLKTVFHKVDVQKGTITSQFRKIYGIMGEEKKDRSQHSHHAVDAAVLTLIPGSASRESILTEAYEHYEMTHKQFHTLPYSKFSFQHIEKIKTKLIVNHVTKDQTLTPTKKYLRRRGKKVWKTNETGHKLPYVLQGDTIRGPLHMESYFGAIKVNERNDNGYPIKENGKYLLRQENGSDELWMVMRKDIEKIDFNKDVIVDELLKKHLKNQLDKGIKQNELVDFNNKRVRHLRCRVKAGIGYLKMKTAIQLKKHIFNSKQEHKQEYYVQNDSNYLYLLYEGNNNNGNTTRGFRIINTFELAKSGIKKLKQLRLEPEYQTLTKGKNVLQLKAILRAGDRVIPYKEHKEEITSSNIGERLFKVIKFNEPAPGTAYVYLQHHLEARPNDVLIKLEEKDFNPLKYQPRIFLSPSKLNCLIENLDFKINNDGSIIWLS
ncbi:MAG TPA: hypothetical protein VEA37_13130, partial [Flavobacterium sp.]|nr:hypothetical protein [Flavobacterium sp.]